MTLNEYQARAAETAVYPEAGTGSERAVTYGVCATVGEAGEIANYYKKYLRGDVECKTLTTGKCKLPVNVRDHLIQECGGLLWELSQLVGELGVTLEAVAQQNLLKLAERKARGTIKGTGDER